MSANTNITSPKLDLILKQIKDNELDPKLVFSYFIQRDVDFFGEKFLEYFRYLLMLYTKKHNKEALLFIKKIPISFLFLGLDDLLTYCRNSSRLSGVGEMNTLDEIVVLVVDILKDQNVLLKLERGKCSSYLEFLDNTLRWTHMMNLHAPIEEIVMGITRLLTEKDLSDYEEFLSGIDYDIENFKAANPYFKRRTKHKEILDKIFS